MKEDELNNLFNEALDNIRKDRKLAREFLNEIANEISNDSEQNKYLSPVAAKHIETMQRSNEQLVKISALLQKKQSSAREELTESDKEELFDIINGGRHDG